MAKYLGTHVSFSRAKPMLTYQEAIESGSTAVSLFTKPPLSKTAKLIDTSVIKQFNIAMKDIPVMVHASYTINLCSSDKDRLKESKETLKCELSIANQINSNVVFHPGTNPQKQQGMTQLANALNEIHNAVPHGITIIETMGGKPNGNVIGTNFDELAYIYSLVHNKDRVKFCFDTCHVFVSGYDITTKDKWDSVFNEFDRKVGISNIYGFHLNDSKTPLSSGHDMHAPIGKGHIGVEPFKCIMNDQRLFDKIMVTETHLSMADAREELNLLRSYHIQGQ